MQTQHRKNTVTTYASAILILLLCASAACAGDVVRLTNGEWPPYFSQELKDGGVGTVLCTAAFALVGIETEYTYIPWKRGLQLARQGEYDGTLGWRNTPERKKNFLISDPFIFEDVVFFHRRGCDFDWKTLDDIGNLTLGGTLGYAYNKKLAQAVQRNGGKLEIAPTDTLNFMKLAEGRIDLFPCAKLVGYHLLHVTLPPRSCFAIRHHPRPITTGGLHLLISKKISNAKELVTRFNQGLKQLRISGQYDQILGISPDDVPVAP